MPRRTRSQILGKRYNREQDELVDRATALQREIRALRRQLRRARGRAVVVLAADGSLQVVELREPPAT